MGRPRSKRVVTTTITASTDNRWHSSIPLGGKRVHRSTAMCETCRAEPQRDCACYRKHEEKVREVEAAAAVGTAAPGGRSRTVTRYLDEWFALRTDLEYSTLVGYRHSRDLLVPHIGTRQLVDLSAPMVHRALGEVAKATTPNEAGKAHRMLRSALSDALRLGYVTQNVASSRLVRPPARADVEEVIPLSVEEIVRVFAVLVGWRTAARWLLAIATGMRQGEVLGLDWADLDLDNGVLTVREKQYRRTWQHGCHDPHACGAQERVDRTGRRLPPLHKVDPCKSGCMRHVRTCPPPCSPNCTRHASSCPKRHSGGIVKGSTKTKKPRTVVLPPPMVAELRTHEAKQKAERDLAGSKWQASGRVFATPFGGPVDHRRDWDDWKAILAAAGVRDLRVHDARHTSATLDRMLNVDPKVSQAQHGWSTSKMADRYGHALESMRRDAAERKGALLWPKFDRDSATSVLPEQGAVIIPFRPRTA